MEVCDENLPYETEAEAISDAYRRDSAGAMEATVLCVDASADINAYLRELLRAAGHALEMITR
jgi:hypothetical protein